MGVATIETGEAGGNGQGDGGDRQAREEMVCRHSANCHGVQLWQICDHV